MSWKSFVTAGLLCIVASPVLAAPTVQVVPGGGPSSGHLNANGDWVWLVRLSQTDTDPGAPFVPVDVDNGGPILPGSPLGAELGFRATTSTLLGAAVATDAGGFGLANAGGQDNPGDNIFGWENDSDIDGNPGITPDDEPVGLQSNCAVGCTENTPGDDPNTVFAALGSSDYGMDPTKDFITITVRGPSTSNLTTTLQMSGAYGGNGRIAELNDAYDGDGNPPYSLNYDTYAGTFSRTAFAGDANLDGIVDDTDLATLLLNFGQPGPFFWNSANFNRQTDSIVDDTDLALLLLNFGMGSPPGSGGGGGAPVPEPATMAMVALAGLGLIGLRRRRS